MVLGVWMVEWEEDALWGELERDPEQGIVGGGGGDRPELCVGGGV